MNLRPALAAFFLSVLPLSGGAEDFSSALVALREGQTVEGARVFHALAQAGDGEAMYNLALLYRQGIGLPKNGELALYWAWRSRLEAIGPAPALTELLAKEATPGHRAAVHDRLLDEIKAQGAAMPARGFMELALVEEGLASKPDAVQLYVWWAMAVALGQAQVLPRRDAALAALSEKQAAEAEIKLLESFSAWCHTASGEEPAICGGLTTSGTTKGS